MDTSCAKGDVHLDNKSVRNHITQSSGEKKQAQVRHCFTTDTSMAKISKTDNIKG